MPDNIIAISDLHLGAPSSLLSLSSVKKRLIEVLLNFKGTTYFILLGDILDLTIAPNANAWIDARRFFHDVFKQFIPDRIYYVPGNHDHHVWTMLIEQRDIVSPLKGFLGDQSDTSRPVTTLLPLQLTGSFRPEDNTFFHALFPLSARNKLHIVYPTLTLPCGERPLIAHHGHYFDPQIMPLAKWAAAKYKKEEKVEEFNFAYVDSLFYFLSLGRLSKEFLKTTYTYYETILHYFSKSIGYKIFKRPVNYMSDISSGRIIDMLKNLCEHNSYILIFGHTHKRHIYLNKMKTIKIYNTGGWLVEDWNSSKPHATPAIFFAQGGVPNLTIFKIDENEIKIAAEKAKNVSPIR
ncbi:MAG TPA: metallophosphoesterase [archaeon]|nr:metallophosphoesterase [archaeon]